MENRKITFGDCSICKHGEDGYKSFETMHDSGVRYRLGI